MKKILIILILSILLIGFVHAKSDSVEIDNVTFKIPPKYKGVNLNTVPIDWIISSQLDVLMTIFKRQSVFGLPSRISVKIYLLESIRLDISTNTIPMLKAMIPMHISHQANQYMK